MREQVMAARAIQRRRFSADGDPEPDRSGRQHPAGSTTTNATMSHKQIRRFCKLGPAGETLLKQGMTELGLSARAHDKVLRIARTIADLEQAESIEAHHLAEAICARGILATAFWNRIQEAA